MQLEMQKANTLTGTSTVCITLLIDLQLKIIKQHAQDKTRNDGITEAGKIYFCNLVSLKST